MIRNVRVLQPEFVPGRVRGRANKIDILTNALEPVIDGDTGETSFLFGPSGVGKTCIARYTIGELEEQAFDITTQYVNAWEDHSRFKLLLRILEGIDETFDIHRQSTPTDELLDRLRDYDDDQYVVVIDEVDQLTDKSLLYDLYRIPQLTMVLIANREEELFKDLDGRLNSRLSGCARIQFSSYTHEQLVSILDDRVEWGLEPDVISRDQLSTIADAASGDARQAIETLRQAAKTAHQNQLDEITDDVIEDAIPEATSEIRQKSLDKLTDDQQTLYEIIETEGQIAPKDLYDRYTTEVSNPVSKRMVRNHLTKMEHYNLVTAEGATRSRTYVPV